MEWYQHNQAEGWRSQEILLSSGIHLSLWSCSFNNSFSHETVVEKPIFGLGYVLEGAASCKINNNCMDFKQDFPHTQFLRPVNSSTEYKPGETFKYLQITMDTNMFSRYWQLVGGSQRYSFDSFVGTQQYAIQQARINYREKICLLELIQTLGSIKESKNQLALESQCLDLLSENLCRLNGKEEFTPSDLHTYEKQHIALARDILLSRLETPPSIIELSRIVGLNDCSLKRGFKLQYGYTIHSFVQRQRLEKAYMLITKDGYNVTQSAFAVGYTSLSHFSKIFNEAFNLFPSDLVKIRNKFHS